MQHSGRHCSYKHAPVQSHHALSLSHVVFYRFIVHHTNVRVVPFLSLALSTIAWFWVSSSVRARRESPLKWQLLTVFTLGEALSVGFISSYYKFRTVVSAMLATAVATTGVSLYTVLQSNPKYDLSQWGAGLSSYVHVVHL